MCVVYLRLFADNGVPRTTAGDDAVVAGVRHAAGMTACWRLRRRHNASAWWLAILFLSFIYNGVNGNCGRRDVRTV